MKRRDEARYEFVSVFEPYCLPTEKASRQLRARLAQHPWLIPDPRTEQESRSFSLFLVESGVKREVRGIEYGNADRDLGPYVMFWRIQRGEITLTRHGAVQFGSKAPFRP